MTQQHINLGSPGTNTDDPQSTACSRSTPCSSTSRQRSVPNRPVMTCPLARPGPPCTSRPKSSLRYRHSAYGGTPQDIDEVIPIVSTSVHFGGCRYWFRCPSCNRRCRIVYGGARFRCRICRGAKYESQYESEPLRICSRRWRIRKLMEERGGEKWAFGLDDGFPPKPPCMHWRTYRRLEALDEVLERRWCIGVGAWLSRNKALLRNTDADEGLLSDWATSGTHAP
jgi:hypothetical protein